MVHRHELTDAQWARISSLLPPERGRACRPGKDNRVMVNAMLWMGKTGAPWRDLPERYGPWSSVWTRMTRWTAQGIWADVLAALAVEHDAETYRGDATVCRTHQHAAGAKKTGPQSIGRSAGGPTTKIHAVVEGLGNPVTLALSPGNEHDVVAAPSLLGELRDAHVRLDKAYDSDPLVAQGCTPVIPPRKNRLEPRAYDPTRTRTDAWSRTSSRRSNISAAWRRGTRSWQ